MKIILAFDGSKFSENAVEFTTGLVGEGSGHSIEVVSVVEPAASLEVETIIESTEKLTDPGNPEAQAAAGLAAGAAERIRSVLGKSDARVTSTVLGGPTARTIVEYAEGQGADLIVIGSHGRGFWKKLWLGSVSERIVRHAHCSVLVVR